MSTIRSKEYPFDLIVNIIDKYDDIDLDWIAKNFDDNLKYLFEKNDSIFSSKEYNILMLYYKNGQTFSDIARKYEVSPDIIKQNIIKTISKLRYPAIIKYIIYGKKVEEKISELRKNKEFYTENYEKINADMSKEEVKQLIIEDCKKNHQSIEDKNIEYLELSGKIINILKRAKIDYIKDLIQYKDKLSDINNLTEKDQKEILKKLGEI